MESVSERVPSAAWDYFTKKNDYIATCTLCNKNYSFKGSVSNLNKHLARKHGRKSLSEAIDTDDEDSDNTTNSHTYQYFDTDDDKFLAVCKVCDKQVNYESMGDLREHAKEHNLSVSDSEWEEKTVEISGKKSIKLLKLKSPVWKHMQILDHKEKKAMCRLCSKQLSYMTSTTNLKKHLKRRHPQIKFQEDEKTVVKMDTVYLEEDILDEDFLEDYEPVKNTSKPEPQPIKRPTTQRTNNITNKSSDEVLHSKNNTDSLDYFGQYIISLLKELPKHVSDQLQSDIIKQIMAAKVVVHAPYSVTLLPEPVTVSVNNKQSTIQEITVKNNGDVVVTETPKCDTSFTKETLKI